MLKAPSFSSYRIRPIKRTYPNKRIAHIFLWLEEKQPAQLSWKTL